MTLRPYDGAKEPDTPDPCGAAHRAAPGPVLQHLQHLSAAQPREALLLSRREAPFGKILARAHLHTDVRNCYLEWHAIAHGIP